MATISSISPTQGNSGDVLTITGTGLGNSTVTTKVNFGARTVTPSTVTPTSVTVTVPPLCGGQYNVSVTVSGSTSNSRSFFYVGAPVCSFLSPAQGPETPTEAVTIIGTGLATTASVTFGAEAPVTTFTTTGDTTVVVTPPAHTVTGDTETLDVVVTTVGGDSVSSSGATQFTYYNLPTVTSVSPATGAAGEAGIVVEGTSFVDVTVVTFTNTVTPANTFDVPLEDIVGLDTTQLVVPAPAGLTSGQVYDITVTTPGGESTTSAADQYTVT
ncbi:IPT/TIG domain-containing protein [Streptomyces sp. NBC_00019]|uniref:IPT/TIG domain-containing protein n=1 Tax=Streptomyces sp. NBC_00019 TaxID=2975623 RepID=UPI0032486BEC